jgi:hypothetical protein
MEWIETQAEDKSLTIKAAFIKLMNGYLILITDQTEFGIGTVTLSAPPSGISEKALTSPFSVFGFKNTYLANIIGKAASKQLGVPVLSLVFIKESTLKPQVIMKTTMDAVNKGIRQILDNNKADKNENSK